MPDINKDLLLSRIAHSKELTAMEKRYLENLVKSPPVKTGHWVREDCDKSGMRCSECHFWKNGVRKTRFCPNCGAEMSGGNSHAET